MTFPFSVDSADDTVVELQEVYRTTYAENDYLGYGAAGLNRVQLDLSPTLGLINQEDSAEFNLVVVTPSFPEGTSDNPEDLNTTGPYDIQLSADVQDYDGGGFDVNFFTLDGVSANPAVAGSLAAGENGDRDYVAVNANFVFPYPETVDPVQAGGMPIVFLTAYHLLKSRGRMEPGHTVLIQAGASGVGTIAIQLARAWGARVIATASTQEKLDLCRSLGADVTINYTTHDFEEIVGQESGGLGVELVLECVGGPVLEKSVRCVAPYGRLVSYGNASGTPANLPASDITTANRTVIGFSIGRSPQGQLDHQAAMAELFPMLAEGKAKLVVDQILPMSEVSKAHQHLANRGTRGKVILTP